MVFFGLPELELGVGGFEFWVFSVLHICGWQWLLVRMDPGDFDERQVLMRSCGDRIGGILGTLAGTSLDPTRSKCGYCG